MSSVPATVEVTLDTAAGVAQFLEYVQDVFFVAVQFEAEITEHNLNAGLVDNSQVVLAEQLHDLYDVMRTEIAAAITAGSMSHVQAEKMQLQYQNLVRLRNQLKEAAAALTSAQIAAEQESDEEIFHWPTQTVSKRLTFAGEDEPSRIAIDASKIKSPAPPTPLQPITPPAAPVTTARSTPTTAAPLVPTASRPAFSPGVQKSAPVRIEEIPLFSAIHDRRLRQRIKEHSNPRQLAQKVQLQIDAIERRQIDKLAAWLGDTPAHTFQFIQGLSVQQAYDLAALPINQLRTALVPNKVRAEAYLYWLQTVTNLQAMYPAKPAMTVGEVVVSALVLQYLE